MSAREYLDDIHQEAGTLLLERLRNDPDSVTTPTLARVFLETSRQVNKPEPVGQQAQTIVNFIHHAQGLPPARQQQVLLEGIAIAREEGLPVGELERTLAALVGEEKATKLLEAPKET